MAVAADHLGREIVDRKLKLGHSGHPQRGQECLIRGTISVKPEEERVAASVVGWIE